MLTCIKGTTGNNGTGIFSSSVAYLHRFLLPELGQHQIDYWLTFLNNQNEGSKVLHIPRIWKAILNSKKYVYQMKVLDCMLKCIY